MQPFNKNSGMALMIVLFSLLFMSIIAYELIYASRVDLRISANARNRLQAFYLAQSSARLSLIRIHLYREAKNLMIKNKSFKVPAELVDQIWSFPIPGFPLAGQVYGEDHFLPGDMNAIIRTEGSLIPINLLDGNIHRNSSKEIAKEVSEELQQLIKSALDNDEAFADRYPNLEPEELVNHLVDWIDENTNKVEGGDELSDYDDYEPPYEPRNSRIPVLSEIRMVAGWNDELYNRFASEFSIYKNSVSINPNYISLNRLKSFHPDLENEDLQKIEEQRRESPFSSLDALANWINAELPSGRGFDFPKEFKTSTSETIFRIEATGIVGLARRVIHLHVRLDDKAPKKPAPSPSGTDVTSGGEGEEGQQAEDKKKEEQELKEPTVVGFEVVV